MESKRKRNRCSISSQESILNFSGTNNNSFSSTKINSENGSDSEISCLRSTFGNKRFKVSTSSQESGENNQKPKTFNEIDLDQFTFNSFNQDLDSESQNETLCNVHSIPKKFKKRKRFKKTACKYKINEENSSGQSKESAVFDWNTDLNLLPVSNTSVEKVQHFLINSRTYMEATVKDTEGFPKSGFGTSEIAEDNLEDDVRDTKANENSLEIDTISSITSTDKFNIKEYPDLKDNKLNISVTFPNSPSLDLSEDNSVKLFRATAKAESEFLRDKWHNSQIVVVFEDSSPSRSSEITDLPLMENLLEDDHSKEVPNISIPFNVSTILNSPKEMNKTQNILGKKLNTSESLTSSTKLKEINQTYEVRSEKCKSKEVFGSETQISTNSSIPHALNPEEDTLSIDFLLNKETPWTSLGTHLNPSESLTSLTKLKDITQTYNNVLPRKLKSKDVFSGETQISTPYMLNHEEDNVSIDLLLNNLSPLTSLDTQTSKNRGRSQRKKPKSEVFTYLNASAVELTGVSLEELLAQYVNTEQGSPTFNLPDFNTTDLFSTLMPRLEENALNISTISATSEALSTGSKENFTLKEKTLRHEMNRITKDKSLIYTGLRKELPDERNNETIKNKILHAIYKVTQQDINQEPVRFVSRNQVKWDNCSFENGIVKLKPPEIAKTTTIRFRVPKNNKKIAKFSVIFNLLCKMYSLLINNSICTQREIYYQFVSRFDNQNQIRKAVNIISCMLNIQPWFLPIVSTSMGLVYGNLTIIGSPGEVINCNSFGGTLIPQDVTKISEFHSDAYFILVVEKDAIFKKVLDEDLPIKFTRPFIVITGKGYPDINTRLFLKKLWMHLRIPVFILVDADAYGIDIMLTYRFGSLTQSHVSEHLAIPKARWIGIHPNEILSLNIKHLPLQEDDRKKIELILKRPYIEENPWLKRELNTLLQKNYKAEIEGVMKNNNYLTDIYLTNKFFAQNYF